jgi:hypothetical protein
MSRTASFLCVVILLLAVFTARATIFENRYIPFLQRPLVHVPDKKSYFSVDVFFATASKSLDKTGNEIGIPELTGVYDQQAVARSFVALGCPNPLPSEFQNQKILWAAEGKIQAQGLEFFVNKHLYKNFYAGFYSYFMRVDTTSAFMLTNTFADGKALLLDRVRRCMNVMAGLSTNDHAAQVGFGDLDCYLMWEHIWEYPYKFRSIAAEGRLGALIPSGQSRNLHKPTSIPFGNDGFWGMYVSGQGEFELKEDWKAGLFLRVSKNFSRTKAERISLFCEPAQYSPLVSDVKINPGAFFVAQLWANFEHVHNGLGARAILTVRRHWKDSWNILCCVPVCDDKTCACIEDETSWGSDYITLNVFYDFSKTRVCRKIDPIIFFAWDIPSSMLETKRTLKTNKIMLGVEFGF